MEEEEEMNVASGGEKMAAGGTGPAKEGLPNSVMSGAETRDKERSGETAGAVGDATDVGTWGYPQEAEGPHNER